MSRLIDAIRRWRTTPTKTRIIAICAIILFTLGAGTLGVAFAASSSSIDGESTGADPTSEPELDTTQLDAIALDAAQAAGDGTPTELEVVSTSARSGVQAIDPSAEPVAETSEAREWLGTHVVLDVMHGHFELEDSSLPAQAKAPTGSILSLLIDADTGAIMFRGLNDTGPSQQSLEALGEVSRIVEPSGAGS
jgi:hypothetical protein